MKLLRCVTLAKASKDAPVQLCVLLVNRVIFYDLVFLSSLKAA